ncbi:MAG: substrate-binding domain-containing protein [Treponema sp.]|nr:substrate-binding domain-containing protein [Candidatus Treponema merdequi]
MKKKNRFPYLIKKVFFNTKVFLLMSAFLMIFFSCTKKTSEKVIPVKQNSITIGFSIDTLAIERWRRDTDVFLATAKELGADVIVQNAGNSIDEQIRQIQYLIDKNVNAIVIVAKQADSLTEVIRNATSNNIPVISYDRLILNASIDLYLTIDSEKVGEKMAKEIVKRSPMGTLYLMLGPKADFNMSMIKSGVEKVIHSSPLHIGEVFYTDDWNYDLSYNQMISYLREDKIPNAIICGNDSVANSVIQAISELKPDANIFIAGQDADIVNCQHIVNSKQTVTVYKPITELAKQAAYCAVRLSKGASAEELSLINGTINNGYSDIPTCYLEPVAVTKENIDEVIINSGFHSQEEVYRK